MKTSRWFVLVLALALPSAVDADDDKGTTDERMNKDKRDKAATHVQTHIVPAIAGIQSADKAAAVLYELSGNEQLRQKDAQVTVNLAHQALTMAINRADALDDVVGLSSDAKTEAARASTALRQARMTLRKLDKRIGGKKWTPNEAEEIRVQVKDLHEDLSNAENAVEQIAKAYDVPIELEFRG
jgi:hypothetical protein